MMNRRDALHRVSMLFGGTIIGAELFLSGCKAEKTSAVVAGFTPENLALLDEVGETIIPTTPDSPGAKASEIGQFMQTIVTDCYEEKDQEIFLAGIDELRDSARSAVGKSFMEMNAEERTTFLTELDNAAQAHEEQKAAGANSHYFTMMKQLTLWGYFTSEVGATQALRYIEAPGRWEGCTDYQPGDKAWAI